MMAPAHTSSLIAPVAALICWSMVMWLWMYATRIPAIRAAGMKLDPNAPRGEQAALLPPRVRWKADNYMHLMEQPTLFICGMLAHARETKGYRSNALRISVLRVIALFYIYAPLP